MSSLSQPRTTREPGDPTTCLEEAVVLFDRDLGSLSLPSLLREELRLRRIATWRSGASPAVANRLAAVEHALARGGAQ